MPEDGLENTSLEQLNSQTVILRERLNDLQSKRSYLQMERDMIDGFFKTTQGKKDETNKKLFLWESHMQELEDQHRREVKMYLQKIKHLELERKNNTDQTIEDGKIGAREEVEWHESKVEELKQVKKEAKQGYVKKEADDSKEVELEKDKYSSNLNGDIENKKKMLQDYEQTLQNEVVDLRNKLDLKLKVELHEIEERKNSHLNELMRNHNAAFTDLKKFYNDITVENLELIKAQHAEIANINNKRSQNKKQINLLREDNKALELPLYRARRDRKILKDTLKQFEKDKMSLGNLKVKLISLKEKLEKLKREKEDLESRQEQCFKDKNNLIDRFDQFAVQLKNNAVKKNQMIAQDFENGVQGRGGDYEDEDEGRNNLIGKFNVIANQMKSYVELQNYMLLGEFDAMDRVLMEREQELQKVIVESKLDPHFINEVTQQVRSMVDQKNAEIKNLRYLIDHATKAYNDAIRVYTTKLQEFNIDPSELGFQIIESKTSTMPAGLVSS